MLQAGWSGGILAGARILSSGKCPEWLRGHTASYSVGTRIFPGGKVDGVKLTTTFNLCHG